MTTYLDFRTEPIDMAPEVETVWNEEMKAHDIKCDAPDCPDIIDWTIDEEDANDIAESHREWHRDDCPRD